MVYRSLCAPQFLILSVDITGHEHVDWPWLPCHTMPLDHAGWLSTSHLLCSLLFPNEMALKSLMLLCPGKSVTNSGFFQVTNWSNRTLFVSKTHFVQTCLNHFKPLFWWTKTKSNSRTFWLEQRSFKPRGCRASSASRREAVHGFAHDFPILRSSQWFWTIFERVSNLESSWSLRYKI